MSKAKDLRIFLSYDRSDSVLARQLAAMLSGVGYDVFPGEDWPKTIQEALKRANAMVVLVSEHSMKSPWVFKEVNYALGSKNYSRRVVPVFVEGSPEVPWILRKFKSVRLLTDVDRTAQLIAQALQSAA